MKFKDYSNFQENIDNLYSLKEVIQNKQNPCNDITDQRYSEDFLSDEESDFIREIRSRFD